MSIIGIGAALVDVLVDVEDEFLRAVGRAKGTMLLVDEDHQQHLLRNIAGAKPRMVCGGSAANCIRGVGMLGGSEEQLQDLHVEAGFIGCIGQDDHGALFRKKLQEQHVTPYLVQNPTVTTGTAVTMITPDFERTMATHLGASATLRSSDLKLEMLGNENAMGYLFVEGYLIYNGELVERIMSMARERGMKVALDLASYNVVAENRDYLHSLVERYVDIVFGNEHEAREFAGVDAEVAAGMLGGMCEIAVVKLGARGSMVVSGDQTWRFGVIEEAEVRDKTGAGDLYAAGFLWALERGLGIDVAGEVASVTSSRVVEVLGATMDDARWNLIRREVAALL